MVVAKDSRIGPPPPTKSRSRRLKFATSETNASWHQNFDTHLHVHQMFQRRIPRSTNNEDPSSSDSSNSKRNMTGNVGLPEKRGPVWRFIEELRWARLEWIHELRGDERKSLDGHNSKMNKVDAIRALWEVQDLAGPNWYQELSPAQLAAVDTLSKCVKEDLILPTGATKTREALVELGIRPAPHSRTIRAAIEKRDWRPGHEGWLLELYRVLERNRKEYSINDRLIMSAVVHLSIRGVFKELHVRIPSPEKKPPAPAASKVQPKRKKPHKSPYMNHLEYQAQHKRSGVYKNTHREYPSSPYFDYIPEMRMGKCRPRPHPYMDAIEDMYNSKVTLVEASPSDNYVIHTEIDFDRLMTAANTAGMKSGASLELVMRVSMSDEEVLLSQQVDPVEKKMGDMMLKEIIRKKWAPEPKKPVVNPTPNPTTASTISINSYFDGLKKGDVGVCPCGSAEAENTLGAIKEEKEDFSDCTCAKEAKGGCDCTSGNDMSWDLSCDAGSIQNDFSACTCAKEASGGCGCTSAQTSPKPGCCGRMCGGVDNAGCGCNPKQGTTSPKSSCCQKGSSKASGGCTCAGGKPNQSTTSNRNAGEGNKGCCGKRNQTTTSPPSSCCKRGSNKSAGEANKGCCCKADQTTTSPQSPSSNQDDFGSCTCAGEANKGCFCKADQSTMSSQSPCCKRSSNQGGNGCTCAGEADQGCCCQGTRSSGSYELDFGGCTCAREANKGCDCQGSKLSQTPALRTIPEELWDEMSCTCPSVDSDDLKPRKRRKNKKGEPLLDTAGDDMCNCKLIRDYLKMKAELEAAAEEESDGMDDLEEEEGSLNLHLCKCEKLYDKFVSGHDLCLAMYTQYRKKMDKVFTEYMDELIETQGECTCNICHEGKDEDWVEEEEIKEVVEEVDYGDHYSQKYPDVIPKPKKAKPKPKPKKLPKPPKKKLPPPVVTPEEDDNFDYASRIIELKRFPKSKKKQMEILVKALEQLKEDGYLLAHLPDCHKLPHFRPWLSMRAGTYISMDQKNLMTKHTEFLWGTLEKMGEKLPIPSLPLTPLEARKLTFGKVHQHRRLLATTVAAYHEIVRRQTVNKTRNLFGVMEHYALPTWHFPQCYFAYLASDERRVQAYRPWVQSTF